MTAPARLQVVVAHPDDETFGCGSLLLHAAGQGAMTAVCCATRGEQGGDGDDLGSIREGELRHAAEVLRVGRVDLLGFRDSGMSGPAGPDSLVGAPFQVVVDAVATAIARVAPDVVVTLDASDGHRDHVRIRDATIQAATSAGVTRLYLACLPRSLMRRWVAHMREQRPDIEHLDADTDALGTPDELLSTVIDAADHLPARERAIAVHSSQTSPFEGLPDDLRRAFLADVHLRQVLPRWSGGPVGTTLFD
ncbi:MAG TPA: PIG-L deacetylase family protein [Nakamurella sp.]|jgi:LmbE family N-acetylglucosaminyl deacetylase|nr:PIG-L deacetylase family protein [Nakamurella sp.]